MASEKPEVILTTTSPYRDGQPELTALRDRFRTTVEDTRKRVGALSNTPTYLLLASMAWGEYNWGSEHNEWKVLFHVWSLATIFYLQKQRRDRERHLQSVLRYESNLALHPDDTSGQEDFKKDAALPAVRFNEEVWEAVPIQGPTLLVSAPIFLQLFVQAGYADIELVKWWHWIIGMFVAQLATRTPYENVAYDFEQKMEAEAKHITPPQKVSHTVEQRAQPAESSLATKKVAPPAIAKTFVRVGEEVTDNTQRGLEPDELAKALELRRAAG